MMKDPVNMTLERLQITSGKECFEFALEELSAVYAITDMLASAKGKGSSLHRIFELLHEHLGYLEHNLEEVERILVDPMAEALEPTAPKRTENNGAKRAR